MKQQSAGRSNFEDSDDPSRSVRLRDVFIESILFCTAADVV